MKRAAAEAVLDAAEEVFGERGIDASMELIAARAGVAVGTLYNHFANREALINALMQARRDEMMSSASTAIARFKGKPFAEQLHGVISALVDTMLERPAFRRALVSGDLPQVFAKKKQFITELHKQLELVLAVGHRQKALRPDTDRFAGHLSHRAAAFGSRHGALCPPRVAPVARGRRGGRTLHARSRSPMNRKAPNKWLVAVSVTFGTLMGAIDASIVNVALSQIRGAVGATVQEITWISTGFAIATVMVMPLTAFFARLFGQKRVYLVCLLIFVVGSALCGIAWNLPSLIFFRALQGFGAGALQPTEQAILRQTFPPKEQGTAMALFAMAVMIGPALGPTLGGYIVDNFHWSWIFFINIPVGALGFFMVTRFVHEPEDVKANLKAEAIKQRKHMDWLGIALLWTTLIAIQYVLEEGATDDWFASPVILIFTVTAVFAGIGFVVRELSAPMPAVNLRLFADRSFTAGTLVSAASFAVLMSGMFLLPLFMQELLGFTAMQSGLALMPRTIVMLFVMPVVGKLYPKFPPALFAGAGLILAGLGQYQLSYLTLISSSGDIMFAICMQGVGMAMLLVPLNTIALANVPRHRLSDATGLSSLLRQIGGSVGLAVFATRLTNYGAVARENMRGYITEQTPEAMSRIAAAPGFGVQMLAGAVARQSMVLAFDKLFILGALMFAAVLPLLFLLKAPKDLGAKNSSEPIHVE